MENKPDKGHKDGSCNRTACQRPLSDEVQILGVRHFMDGNFTGGPRLYYCAKCSADFTAWDIRSGDPRRIKTESVDLPDSAARLRDFHNRLRVLNGIDLWELENAGLSISPESWAAFVANPWRWFIRADDETAEKVWAVIEQRAGRTGGHG